MKDATGRCDIMMFSLTSVTKSFIEQIIKGTSSVQIPTHWFHDRPQDSKQEGKMLKMSWLLVVSGSFLQQ
jgi:hypothetical protein